MRARDNPAVLLSHRVSGMLFHVQMRFERYSTIHLQKLHHGSVICFIRCLLVCMSLGVYCLLTEHLNTSHMKCSLKELMY